MRNCSEEVEEKPGYIIFETTDKIKPPGSEISKYYHLLRKNAWVLTPPMGCWYVAHFGRMQGDKYKK